MAFLSHPDVEEQLQVPGYVFWNPLALDEEANWGTKLGFSETGITLVPGSQFADLTKEETGEEITGVVFVGAQPTIQVVFLNWNATAMGVLFPGRNSGKAITEPGTIKPGISITSSTYAKPLLFVPQDTDNDPCLLVQTAAPTIGTTAKIRLSHRERTFFLALFRPIRKSSDADGIYYFGPLSGANLR